MNRSVLGSMDIHSAFGNLYSNWFDVKNCDTCYSWVRIYCIVFIYCIYLLYLRFDYSGCFRGGSVGAADKHGCGKYGVWNTVGFKGGGANRFSCVFLPPSLPRKTQNVSKWNKCIAKYLSIWLILIGSKFSDLFWRDVCSIHSHLLYPSFRIAKVLVR